MLVLNLICVALFASAEIESIWLGGRFELLRHHEVHFWVHTWAHLLIHRLIKIDLRGLEIVKIELRVLLDEVIKRVDIGKVWIMV